jgi:predicted lipoprotein with Yx(FWY)xxD motif
MRNRGWASAGAATSVGGLVLLLAACGSSGTGTNAGAAYSGSGMGATPSSSSMPGADTTSGMGTTTASLTIKATTIGKVLTNAQGDTLYTYSKDTRDGPSTCTGSCLAEWPQVKGKAVAASGAKFAGILGGVTDPGGAIQATYDGYPLYTYAGDMTAGQTSGNDAGGVWHVVTGSTLAAAAGNMMSSPSAAKTARSSGGYGYGAAVPVSSGTSSGSKTSATRAQATTAPAPVAPAPATAAPAPATTAPATTPSPGSTDYAGCGEGACW